MAEQHEKALVPQIRFTGFTDPWEQRKLGELFEEHSEKDRDDLPALTIIQGGGTVHRDESNRNLQFDRNSLSNYKVVDTGDFIVHLRSFEGGLEKATCCGLVSPAYHIFRGKNVDSDFYYLYFRSKRFIDADLKPHVYGIRDGRSIDIEGMKTIFIPWTNLAEQRRIGAFFDHLDSLITLHQRKYDKLCVLKKSMLDKMFPKGGSLYPEIRFAGFTDPWEQRKLGELFEEHSEKDRDDLPALTIIQGGGTVHRDESNRNLQFDRNSLSNYKVVDTGDFIVHLRSFEGGLEKATCCGLVSPAYHIFRGKNVDSDFYYLYFRSKRFIDADLKPHVYGIRDGRSIDIEGMKTIFIPWTNLAEQRRIGAFFDHLDSLITLHQRKYDKLCVLKKSMLDKMFPKGGSLYPEIRFAGFTDPWEQRKLGELSNEFKSGEFICADNVSVSGSYPVYGGNGLRGYTTTFNHEGLYTLIGRQGALCGNVNIADGKSYFTEHAVAVKANHLNDTTFLYYLFGTLDLGQYSGQSAQPGLAVSNLVEVEAMVPDKAEQKKISRVFKTVDSLITLHQRKLELLRNIKKSMLDKMFV